MNTSRSTLEAMTGLPSGKKKTHRGRRGKGKGSKEHHADAKQHLANAQAASDPKDSTKHLFKALTSLKKATTGTPPIDPMSNTSTPAC